MDDENNNDQDGQHNRAKQKPGRGSIRQPGRVMRKALEVVTASTDSVDAAEVAAKVYRVPPGTPVTAAQDVAVRRALADLVRRGQVRDTGRSGHAGRRLYARLSTIESKPVSTSGTDESHASPETLIRFLEVRGAWERDGGIEAEAASLKAALPVLQAVRRRLSAEADSNEDAHLNTEARALDLVLVALEDRLNGRGWRSLTTRTGGQGTNVRQRRARKFALDYIEAAESGRIEDPDPRGTICAAYDLADRDTISRWRRKEQIDEYDNSLVFDQSKEKATREAKSILMSIANHMSRGPSDTSP